MIYENDKYTQILQKLQQKVEQARDRNVEHKAIARVSDNSVGNRKDILRNQTKQETILLEQDLNEIINSLNKIRFENPLKNEEAANNS